MPLTPFTTQSQGWRPCLLTIILCHKDLGSRAKHHNHLANRALLGNLKFSNSNTPNSQVSPQLLSYPDETLSLPQPLPRGSFSWASQCFCEPKQTCKKEKSNKWEYHSALIWLVLMSQLWKRIFSSLKLTSSLFSPWDASQKESAHITYQGEVEIGSGKRPNLATNQSHQSNKLPLLTISLCWKYDTYSY